MNSFLIILKIASLLYCISVAKLDESYLYTFQVFF